MKMYSLIFGTIFMHLPFISSAQSNHNSLTRPIIINSGDSIIHAYIQTEERKYKPINGLLYYWFFAESIHCNRGGYSGNLLHNNYLVYNRNKNMIERGSFINGLKTGCWKTWYPGGGLRTVTNWKSGIIYGISKSYSQNGLLQESTEYKNGMKNGVQLQVKNDSIIKYVYRKGIIVRRISLVRSQRDEDSKPGDAKRTKKRNKFQPLRLLKKHE